MKKISSISGLAALVVFLVSGPMTYGQAQSSPPEVDVTGMWQGQWRPIATKGNYGGDVSLKLNQQGSAVTGTMSMEHSARFGAGEKPIENGRVSGRTFSFTVHGEHAIVRPTLTIEDGRMSGEFQTAQFTTRFDLKKVQ